MAKCIIHVGMHKTGTTSIQNSLKSFENDTFVYARLGNNPNHSVQIYSLFADSPERHPLNENRRNAPGGMAAYLESVGRDLANSISLAGSRTLLISGELIGYLDEAGLAKLRDRLVPHFESVEVVAYVRAPLSYMTSAFQQMVRGGRRTVLGFDRLYRSYRDSFEKFDRVFGRSNVSLWKYDRGTFAGGDVVQDFCGRIGLDLGARAVEVVNESKTTREMIALMFQYNRYCAQHGYKPMAGVQSAQFCSLLDGLQATPFQFSSDLLQETLTNHQQDIAWMEERLGQSLAEQLPPPRDSDVRHEKDLLSPVPGAKRVLRQVLQPAGVAVAEASGEGVCSIIHQLRTEVIDKLGRKADAQSRKARRDDAAPGTARKPLSAVVTGRDGSLLTRGPRPLLNADKNLTVLWSPKSACTAVYVWFSHLSGFSEAVKPFGLRVHKHRTDHYYHSDLYRQSLEAEASQANVLRIVRDPYQRAVSIYRHAIKTAFADIELEQEMGKTAAGGLSFQEFLDFLGKIDVSHADVHMRPQFHPYETVRQPGRYINISKQNLFAELNRFENDIGAAITDFNTLDWFHNQEEGRKAKQEAMQGDRLDETVFNRHQVRDLEQFPSYQQLLTPEARQKIERIYKVDFDAYRDYL